MMHATQPIRGKGLHACFFRGVWRSFSAEEIQPQTTLIATGAKISDFLNVQTMVSLDLTSRIHPATFSPMAEEFRVIRRNDLSVAKALVSITDELAYLSEVKIRIQWPHGQNIAYPIQTALDSPELHPLFEQNTEAIRSFQIWSRNTDVAINYNRPLNQVFDTLAITDPFLNHLKSSQPDETSKRYVSLFAAIRKAFETTDSRTLAALEEKIPWAQHQESMLRTLDGLKDAAEVFLFKAAQRAEEADQKRKEKFEALEKELQDKFAEEQEAFEAEKQKELGKLEKTRQELADQEKSFETRESHYVARHKRDEQIEQVQRWLEDWKLTKGTSGKRTPVAIAYIAGLLATLSLTIWTTSHSIKLMNAVQTGTGLHWSHWVFLGMKVLSFAGFITILTYFIRWTSSWARIHAEEEFRNRALLIDIGRSGWLLEAVRDAQERGSEIPEHLLKELSRNLFSYAAKAEHDIDPSAFSDVLMQGLSSLRLKSPDGSEIEAQRGKPK